MPRTEPRPERDTAPPLVGRVVVVTGGSTGLGSFTSEQLARLGASVVIAARDADRAARAVISIEQHVPGAQVRHVPLDLARIELHWAPTISAISRCSPARVLVRSFAHGKHLGAAPLVTAATAPGARNGDYWGPSGWQQLRGQPARLTPHPAALDAEDARRLVALSEELTGIRLPV